MISFSNINKQYGKQLLFVDGGWHTFGSYVGTTTPENRLTPPEAYHKKYAATLSSLL